jgi:mannose-6-phosphate isomerase-like protein (cupin superfamily)
VNAAAHQKALLNPDARAVGVRAPAEVRCKDHGEDRGACRAANLLGDAAYAGMLARTGPRQTSIARIETMTDFPASYLLPAGAGLAGDPGLKASRASTGGSVSVFETSIGAGPPLHVHEREDECFYVLAGLISVRCGTEAFTAAAGSFVFLPRGRPHRFWSGGEPARLLLISAPGGIEDYFAEINAAAGDAGRELAGERHGIRVVPEQP